MSIRFNRKSLLTLAAVGACGVAAGPAGSGAKAAVTDWNGATSNWSTATNWSNGLPTNDLVSSIAEFGSVAFTNQPGLTAAYSVNGIVDQGTTPAAVTISGSALSVGSGGIVMNAGSGSLTFSNTLSVAQNQTWSIASSNNLSITTLVPTTTALNINRTGTGNVTTTTTGILVPEVTYTDGTGTYYANVTSSIIGALTGTSITDVSAMGSTSGNYEINGGTLTNNTLTAGGTARTIRYTGAAQTLQLGDAGHSNVNLTAYGLMNAGTDTLTIADGTSDGTGAFTLTNTNTVFTAATANIDLEAAVVNTSTSTRDIVVGVGSGEVQLNKLLASGTGAIILEGASTAANPIYIGSSGTLDIEPTHAVIDLYGSIAGSGHVTYGAGSVVIGAFGVYPQNSYVGDTTLNSGTFLGTYASMNSPFGAANNNVLVESGSTIYNQSTSGETYLNYNYTMDGDFTLNNYASPGLTLPGTWTLNRGTVTITTQANTGIGAVGQAAAQTDGLTVRGLALLTLGATSFTGTLTVGTTNTNGESTFTAIPSVAGFENAIANTFTLAAGTTAGLVVGEQVSGTGTSYSKITAMTPTSITFDRPLGYAVYQNATGTSGQNTITLAATTSVQVGQAVTGTGIQSGTTITNITGLVATLSAPLNANITASRTYFYGGNQTLSFNYVDGSVALSGADTGNDIILNPSGELSLGSVSLGTSTLTINGGVITSAANIAVTGTPTYIVAGDFTMGTHVGNNNINLSAGSMILDKTIAIAANDSAAYVNTLGSISDGTNGYGLTLTAVPGNLGSFTLSGNVTMGGPLTISGVTATLSNAANGYTGDTVITAGGTLKLTPPTADNNNIAFSPNIVVGPTPADNSAVLDVSGVAGISASGFHVVSGQTLAGYGGVNGKITVDTGGHLAPGNSIGTLTVNNSVTLNGSSDFEINDDTTTSDLLTGSTKLTYGGNLNVTDLGDTNDYSVGQTFTLFTLGATGTESGAFANISLPTLPAGLTWETFGTQPFNYANGQIVVEAGSPVPEPASLMMLGLGGLALLVRRRRRD